MALALISGGTGLIGSALVELLNQKGHKSVVLTRGEGGANKNTEYVHWDGIHPELWTEWVEKADWIINLVGENIGAGRWSETRIREIIESRVYPGELLTEAIARASNRPKVFLQMSAIGCYGVQDVEVPAAWDESHPIGNDPLSEICREWEASSARIEDLGLRRIVTRTGLVLSPRGGVLNRLQLPFKLFVGGPLGSGKQVYSWIHVEDLVSAMIYLLENDSSGGVYNLTAPHPVTNAEFGKTIARILNRPYWLPIPGFALRLLLGEMSTLVVDGQRVIPGRLTSETGYSFQYPELYSALQQIFSKPG